MDIKLFGIEFGHFLDVDADALTVKQDEVDGLDGGRHGGHEVAIDGFQDQLSGRLLRETVPKERDKKPTHCNRGTVELAEIRNSVWFNDQGCDHRCGWRVWWWA